MSDYAPRWRRALSGGPIIRGHWAALIFLPAAGLFADKIEFVDRWTSQTGDYTVWWWTDWWWLGLTIISSILGWSALTMYGRNCWLTWAPDDVTWNGLSRDECNRVPLIRRPGWLMFNDRGR